MTFVGSGDSARAGERVAGIAGRAGALNGMRTHLPISPTISPDPSRLAITEAALAAADSLWRAEMRRNYGPDGVLAYGYTPEGQGGLGTQLRRTYEARRVAVALWRQERHRTT